MGIIGVLHQIFTGVSSNLACPEQQNVLVGNVVHIVQDIFNRGKGNRSGTRGNFCFIFDSLAGLDYRIAQAFQERIGHVLLFGSVKPLLYLADDFKVAQNLTVQTSAHFKHMRNGIMIFIHVGHFLKFFNGTRGFVAEQFDKLVGVLCKTV